MKKIKYSFAAKMAALILLFITLAALVAGTVFFAFSVGNGYLTADDVTDTDEFYYGLESESNIVAEYYRYFVLNDPVDETDLNMAEHLDSIAFGYENLITNKSSAFRFALVRGGAVVLTNMDISVGTKETELDAYMSAHLYPMERGKTYDYHETETDFTIYRGVTKTLTGLYATSERVYSLIQSYSLPVGIVMGFCLVLFFVLFIFLSASAGYCEPDEGIRLQFIDKIMTDLFLIMCGFAAVVTIAVLENMRISVSGIERIIVAVIISAVLYSMLMTAYLSIVRRLRAHTFIKNTLVYIICKFIADIFHNIGTVYKAVLGFAGYITVNAFLSFVLYQMSFPIGFFLLLFFNSGIFSFICYKAINFSKILKTAKLISGGSVVAKVDLLSQAGDMLELAKSVNGIGDGIQSAVERQMRSERMKTDLIANVSHDLRTPLTSIISYVGLLKKEQNLSPESESYIEVLERKSDRLLHLAEDLIEASRTSSGNIEIIYEKIDLSELVLQSVGEYSDRFSIRGLDVVACVPENPVFIHADGRRIWRVLENALSNIYKYSLQNSRVYIDLSAENGRVSLTMKNISTERLNISSDELMERFVRGDAARTSDGNGLGLSIARSLVELQSGKFDISIDGDLFKLSISFAQA